jgi:hypothetical protein
MTNNDIKVDRIDFNNQEHCLDELREGSVFYGLNDTSPEPDVYYHSTGAMNPVKLIGILKEGILSMSEAENRGLSIDTNGLRDNGKDFVSVATIFCGCMNKETGAFHVVIDKSKLTTFIRKNPQEYMPLERQVYKMVPRSAIKAIQLEEESFIDIEEEKIMLVIDRGLKKYNVRQVESYIGFMEIEFQHEIPAKERLLINELVEKLDAKLDSANYFEKGKIREKLEKEINVILKKHLKICYQEKLGRDKITPYDILRYHDKEILVYDASGKEMSSEKLTTKLIEEKIRELYICDPQKIHCSFGKKVVVDGIERRVPNSVSLMLHALSTAEGAAETKNLATIKKIADKALAHTGCFRDKRTKDFYQETTDNLKALVM